MRLRDPKCLLASCAASHTGRISDAVPVQVLLWPTYPNLGLDERNQFDLIRLSNLAGAIDDFHERGVRVLLPYNPWDEATRREGRPDATVPAELSVKLNADGFNSDTMQVPREVDVTCVTCAWLRSVRSLHRALLRSLHSLRQPDSRTRCRGAARGPRVLGRGDRGGAAPPH